jgi:hypothetical protein
MDVLHIGGGRVEDACIVYRGRGVEECLPYCIQGDGEVEERLYCKQMVRGNNACTVYRSL